VVLGGGSNRGGLKQWGWAKNGRRECGNERKKNEQPTSSRREQTPKKRKKKKSQVVNRLDNVGQATTKKEGREKGNGKKKPGGNWGFLGMEAWGL